MADPAPRVRASGTSVPRRPGRRAVIAGGGAIAAGAWARSAASADGPVRPISLAERTGSVFLPPPRALFAPPRVERLALPAMTHPQAIWGATGRDVAGRIWFGVSAATRDASARLLCYTPRTRRWRIAGAVDEQLRRLGLLRPGETQLKIHSKVVTGEDGLLYFASSDEDGERADGSALPRWGGHLWRTHPDGERWEHLFAAPEALIAAGAGGRCVYALGYWNHVLHQYDVRSGRARKVVVGAVGGHITRNFLVDLDGHAYVPRVARVAGGLRAMLVEYDADLNELAATPLEHYLVAGSQDDNHGITGIATLPDGRMAFTTAPGHLYLVAPRRGAAAIVTPLGWFHPEGEAYAPSLFAYGGGNLLAGVTQRGSRFEWVVFETLLRNAVALPLDTRGAQHVLLYGSQARDDEGGCYLTGWASDGTAQRPLVLRVTPVDVPAQK